MTHLHVAEENEEVSMLQETCRFLGCNSFVSTFTEPYCLDHVGRDNNSEHHNGPERNLGKDICLYFSWI